MEESLEILASDLNQGRQSAEQYQNLIMAWVAYSCKCPGKGLPHTIHSRSGLYLSHNKVHDKAGRLEKLEVEPMSRAFQIFDH